MLKKVEFYHDKRIDMLKLGCTLPNSVNICLHKSTDYKFYPFFSSDSDLLEKIQEDMTVEISFFFTRKRKAKETFNQNLLALYLDFFPPPKCSWTAFVPTSFATVSSFFCPLTISPICGAATLKNQLQVFFAIGTIFFSKKRIEVLPRICATAPKLLLRCLACPRKMGKIAELWAILSYEL